MGTMTFDADAATGPLPIQRRGGSLYIRVPKDWPEGAQARALLLPTEATP